MQWKYLKDFDQWMDVWNNIPIELDVPDLDEQLERIMFDGFCACGNPEILVEEMGKLLAKADNEGFVARPETPLDHALLYWADAVEFTEHGTSVYGSWLTDKGSKWLSMWKENQQVT